MWSPNDAERLHRKEGWQLGRVQRRVQRKREIIRVDARKEYVKLSRKWQKMKLDAWLVCRKFLSRSTDVLRRITAPVGGMGGVTLSCVCPHCKQFSFGGLHLVGYRRGHLQQQLEKRTAVGGARCVEANTNGEHPT